jgi:nucleotide-binding universal stress UspA family protein
MPRFKRILFPIAFSPQCEATTPCVAAYARKFDAEVVLLHCDPPPLEIFLGEPQTDRLREMLDQFMPGEFEGLKVTRLVRIGDPASQIVRCANEEAVDLIMMPTHGYGPFRRFVLGSVTAKVLHDATCPVWTSAHLNVGAARAPQNFTNILCAVDLDRKGVETLRYAAGMASETGARLTVAHAIPSVETVPEKYLDFDFRSDLIEAARTRLAEMQALARAPGVACVGSGNIARFVSEEAQAHNAGLVIISRGGHKLLGRLRTHDYAIIRECECPVLSI